MAYTIADLIRELEDLQEEFGPDTEVRLMTQPNYPFEWSIYSTTVLTKDGGRCMDDVVQASDDPDDEEWVAYITEGTQLGYGHKEAWNT